MQRAAVIKKLTEIAAKMLILNGAFKTDDTINIINNMLKILLIISETKALFNICIYLTYVFKYSFLPLSFLAYPANTNKSAIHSINKTNAGAVSKII